MKESIQWLLWAWGQYADRLVTAELDYGHKRIAAYEDDSYSREGKRYWP